MATQFARGQPGEGGIVAEPHSQRRAFGVVEALFAAGAVVLAIIGLAGVVPRFLDTIASIALGVAFVFERWTIAGRSREAGVEAPQARALTVESIAGWMAIVLGILSLLRLAPTVLNPIALIVLGAGLALGPRMATRYGRVVMGVCGVVLGILALIQINPRTLTLIGLLAVSGTLLLTGPMVAWRARHHTARPVGAV